MLRQMVKLPKGEDMTRDSGIVMVILHRIELLTNKANEVILKGP